MSIKYFAGFVVVAGIAVAAADYVNQSQRAGVPASAYGVTAYLDTYGLRLGEYRAARAAAALRADLLARPPRELLPAAPEGWTRRDWTAADAQLLTDRRSGLEGLPEDLPPALVALMAADEAAQQARDAREIQVYERDDGSLVALWLSHADPRRRAGGIQGMAMSIVAGNMEAMSGRSGFALVQGVAYREALGLFGLGGEERPYRVFTGRLGAEVTISARAIAADEDVLALLAAIDVDRLNAMLAEPLPGVGSAAPELDPAEERALAEARIAAEAEAVIARGAEMERLLREAATRISGSAQDEAAVAAEIDALERAAEGGAQADGGMLQAAGGFFGRLFGGGGDARAEERSVEVRVNRSAGSAGVASCSTDSAFKRCRVGE